MNNESCYEKSKEVSEPTIRRLAVYHHYLLKIRNENISFISCTQIALNLGLVPIQVRKDLEVTGVEGKPKVGYEVSALLAAIEKFLCWSKVNSAVLAGAGHLGYAILGYQGFCDYGLNITAAFDNDFLKIGKFIHGKPVYSADSMEEYIKKHKIEVGILTVPAKHAQELADIMIKSGIKAIWNFAPAKITSENTGVVIQHENLASSFAVLSNKINTEIKRS